jgi:hypothetical protein
MTFLRSAAPIPVEYLRFRLRNREMQTAHMMEKSVTNGGSVKNTPSCRGPLMISLGGGPVAVLLDQRRCAFGITAALPRHASGHA